MSASPRKASARDLRARMRVVGGSILLLGGLLPAGAAGPPFIAAHAGSDSGHDRRQPPERARLPRRLAARLRRDPPGLRRRGRRLAGAFNVPAGSYEYKAPSTTAGPRTTAATPADGANIPLQPGRTAASSSTTTTRRHWITDNVNSVIAAAPGSFQTELGCPGDWEPGLPALVAPGPRRRRHLHVQTTAIPAGNYEAKVAINESWDENYGQGGGPAAPTSPSPSRPTRAGHVQLHAATHVLTVLGRPRPRQQRRVGRPAPRLARHALPDAGRRGPAGTPVTLRFRTFHDDVTGVKLRIYSLNAGGQQLVPMTLAASDVACYQAGPRGRDAATSGS